MSGRVKGVRAHITAEVPHALYVHCGAHALNLSINHASSVTAIRNCVGTIKEVVNFMNASPSRIRLLKGTCTFCAKCSLKLDVYRLYYAMPKCWKYKEDEACVYV